ncbi:hypothetical protein B0H11DRAFT_1313697 [Mycena galericulata]|nr:hypothetical protein B0H11DRAFT_1313697 [Mycena galericulata]
MAGIHMLMLNVKTRWSSTHQTMNRALKHRSAINRFIANNRDLHDAELTAGLGCNCNGIGPIAKFPFYALLDPRFNYKNFRKDKYLADYLEIQTRIIQPRRPLEHLPLPPSTRPRSTVPRLVNFAALGQDTDGEEEQDELDSCFDAPETNPVQWWYAQYPRLYRLARHHVSCARIVAQRLYRLFSGGRDTISLRRARLNPETTRTLMLLKHHLRLRRKTLEDAYSLQLYGRKIP